jgi:signal peptide peptidase SppA
MNSYSHITQFVLNTPWAITSEKLLVIMDVLAYHAQGGHYTAEEIQERLGAVQRPLARASGAVAVLPLYGVIAQRMGMMTESSGGVSTEQFARQFRAAVDDSQVGAIVIDVDSPGGTVSGVDELSAEIHAARGTKPIVAVANSLAASAAYWIATAADELVVTPTGEVGSIGVLAAHEDASGWYEQQGVKPTLISAGKYKTEGNPYEPLSEEGRAHLQERVDEYYDMFVKAVARNRGVGVQAVRDGFGEGRVVGAKQAKALGMVDRIETLDQTLVRMQRGQRRRVQTLSELDRRARRLRAMAR